MPKFEYKVVHMPPRPPFTLSQKVRDELNLEKVLNQMADEGWEVLSCTTTVSGGFLYLSPITTVILRREKILS